MESAGGRLCIRSFKGAVPSQACLFVAVSKTQQGTIQGSPARVSNHYSRRVICADHRRVSYIVKIIRVFRVLFFTPLVVLGCGWPSRDAFFQLSAYIYGRVARDEGHLNASYSQLKEPGGRSSGRCIGLAGRESAVVDKKLP